MGKGQSKVHPDDDDSPRHGGSRSGSGLSQPEADNLSPTVEISTTTSILPLPPGKRLRDIPRYQLPDPDRRNSDPALLRVTNSQLFHVFSFRNFANVVTAVTGAFRRAKHDDEAEPRAEEVSVPPPPIQGRGLTASGGTVDLTAVAVPPVVPAEDLAAEDFQDRERPAILAVPTLTVPDRSPRGSKTMFGRAPTGVGSVRPDGGSPVTKDPPRARLAPRKLQRRSMDLKDLLEKPISPPIRLHGGKVHPIGERGRSETKLAGVVPAIKKAWRPSRTSLDARLKVNSANVEPSGKSQDESKGASTSAAARQGQGQGVSAPTAARTAQIATGSGAPGQGQGVSAPTAAHTAQNATGSGAPRQGQGQFTTVSSASRRSQASIALPKPVESASAVPDPIGAVQRRGRRFAAGLAISDKESRRFLGYKTDDPQRRFSEEGEYQPTEPTRPGPGMIIPTIVIHAVSPTGSEASFTRSGNTDSKSNSSGGSDFDFPMGALGGSRASLATILHHAMRRRSPIGLLDKDRDVPYTPIIRGPNSGPKQELSVMQIFMNEWRNQELTEVEVVPDPSSLSIHVTILSERLFLIFCIISTLGLLQMSMWYYVSYLLPNTYAGIEIKRLLLPARGIGSVLEYGIVPFLFGCLGNVNVCYPDPREWGFKTYRCTPRMHWAAYFTLVGYMFAISWIPIIELIPVPDRVKAKMVADHPLYMTDGDSGRTWDLTQAYFGCCGVYNHQEWLLVPGAMVSTYLEHVDQHLVQYPMACCNNFTSFCFVRPVINEVWKYGCYELQLRLIRGVIGVAVGLNLLNVFLACLAFVIFYAYEAVSIQFKNNPIVEETYGLIF